MRIKPSRFVRMPNFSFYEPNKVKPVEPNEKYGGCRDSRFGSDFLVEVDLNSGPDGRKLGKPCSPNLENSIVMPYEIKKED